MQQIAMTTALRHLMYYWQSLARIGDQGTILNAYQLLKDHMIGTPFYHCKDAGDVCKLISKDNFYTMLSPELQKLANIALTIPLSTAWPERGFSTLSRVKTKHRNRLSDSTLSAAINISMNEPPELSEDDALTNAKAWLNKKERREVNASATTTYTGQTMTMTTIPTMKVFRNFASKTWNSTHSFCKL